MSASQSEAILLTTKQRSILTEVKDKPSTPTNIARRAELILEIARKNRTNYRISQETSISYAMVKLWRNRWITSQVELAAVEDAGTSTTMLEARIMDVLANRSIFPENLGSSQVNTGHNYALQTGQIATPLMDSALPQLTDEQLAELVKLRSQVAQLHSAKAEIVELREQVTQLEEENADLQLILETMTEHSDLVSDELHQEKEDLELMLEMTTEHSDTVSEELQEKAEEALRESERRLRLIVQATPVPVIITRIADQEVQYANHMAGPLLGIGNQEIVGHQLTHYFTHKQDWQSLITQLENSQAVDEFEMELTRADSSQVWVTASMRPLEFNETHSVLTAFHDITERKIGEIQLQQQVEQLRAKLDEARHSSSVAEQSGTAFFSNMDAIEIKHSGVRLIAVHSFRGGTGKSFIVSNIAALLAANGQRVGVIDTSLQSPGVHLFFGVEGHKVEFTLNDLLWENCSSQDAVYEVTERLGANLPGKVFLVPASTNPGHMAQILSHGYAAEQLTNSIHQLTKDLSLDVLLIDTQPGMNEEALLAVGAAHAALIVLRPEHQDYEGTGIAVQIAQKLQVPSLSLVVNQVPSGYESATVRARVEQAFGSPVAAVLPFAQEITASNGNGIFAVRNPDHPLSMALQRITSGILGGQVDNDLLPTSNGADSEALAVQVEQQSLSTTPEVEKALSL